jgi:hypothetical protein
VDGPVMVRRLNIDGDGQSDTNGHGGEQRAVLVYQIQSCRHWQQYFGRDDFGHGSSDQLSVTIPLVSRAPQCRPSRLAPDD